MTWVASAGSAVASTSGVFTHTCNYNKSLAAGRLVVVTFGMDLPTVQAVTATCTDSAGNTYTRTGSMASAANTLAVHQFFCVLTNAVTTSTVVTCTYTGTTAPTVKIIALEEFNDVLAASPLDGTPVTSTSTGVAAFGAGPTAALSQNNELSIASTCHGVRNILATSPYTLTTVVDGTNRGVHLSYRNVTDGAAQTSAGTLTTPLNSNTTFATVLATLKVVSSTASGGPNLTGIEPRSEVILEGKSLSGGVPTVWAWEFVSATNGATIPLDGLGAARTSRADRPQFRFTAPAIMSTGTVMTFRVRITENAVVSPWATVTVSVLPATEGVCTSTGPVVVGAAVPVRKINPFPFDMPSTATMRGYAKKVTVNFYAGIPIVLGNAVPRTNQPGPYQSVDYPSYHWLETVTTESSSDVEAANKGGYYRDRPTARYPIATSNIDIPDSGTGAGSGVVPTSTYRIEDRKTEIRHMIEAGVDVANFDYLALTPIYNGTTLVANVQGDVQHSYACSELMYAATQVDSGFKVRLWLDMSSGSSLQALTPTQMAQLVIGKNQAYPNTLDKTASGAIIIGGGASEKWNASQTVSASNWKAMVDYMATQGVKATLMLGFYDWADANPYFRIAAMNGSSSMGEPYMYGESDWGANAPVTFAARMAGDCANAQAAGRKFQMPVRYSDLRVGAVDTGGDAKYDDSHNSENLRVSYGMAITDGADEVQYITWGDLSEQSTFMSTAMHGLSRLHLAAYYAVWFKTGTAPTITQDAVYLSHRTQHSGADVDLTTPVRALPVGTLGSGSGQIYKMLRRNGKDNTYNDVEAVAFLTSPATVTINVGGTDTVFAGSTGLNVFRTQIREGAVRATVQRAGVTTVDVTSPHIITYKPWREDLGYYGTSSLVPTPPPVGMGVFPKVDRNVVLRCTPVEDTFVHSSSAGVNYGGDPTLQVNGGTVINAYIRFNIPVAPVGKTLTSAVLELKTIATGGSAQGFKINMLSVVNDTWTETGTTYTTRPTTTDSVQVGGPFTPSAVSTVYSITLTLAEIAALEGTTRGFAILTTGTTSDVAYFNSSRSVASSAVDGEPTLVLTYV